jgi:hypothetical protein
MADYNSSLPVRTENNGDVVSKIADATTPSQQLKVYPNGSIDVNTTNLPTTVNTDYGTVGANTIRTAAQIGNAAGAADFNSGATGAQTLRTEANQGAPNSIANAWPTKVTDGTNTLAINADGSITAILSNDVPGTEVCDRQTTTAVAAGASTNHDYTVTAGKTFTAEQVVVSGSGKIKVQVLFNGVIKFDAFNSTAQPTVIIPMLRLIKAAAAQVVRITITNKDNQAQDLYSTLMGEETP